MGDHQGLVPVNLEPKNPSTRGIQKPKPDATAGPYVQRGRATLAIDEHHVAEPARVGRVVEAFEVGSNGGVLGQHDVRDRPQHIVVDIRRLPLLDHNRSKEPPTDLLIGGHVGVVPKGACVRQCKLVLKILSGFYRGLGHARHAVHVVGQPYAVPVQRREHGQPITKSNPNGVALNRTQHGTGNHVVEGPDIGARVIAAQEFHPGRPGDDRVITHAQGPRGPGQWCNATRQYCGNYPCLECLSPVHTVNL